MPTSIQLRFMSTRYCERFYINTLSYHVYQLCVESNVYFFSYALVFLHITLLPKCVLLRVAPPPKVDDNYSGSLQASESGDNWIAIPHPRGN